MEGKETLSYSGNITFAFRGKGYYDTFLSKVKQKYGTLPPTIALAFKQQVVDHVPTDEHDVVIDTILFNDE